MRTGRYGLDRAVERGKLTRADADADVPARLRFTVVFEDLAVTGTSSSRPCPSGWP